MARKYTGCKIVNVNGKKRNMCWKNNKIVSNKPYSGAKRATNSLVGRPPSERTMREEFGGRSKKSKAVDRYWKAKKQYMIGDAGTRRWLNDPSTSDVIGIDRGKHSRVGYTPKKATKKTKVKRTMRANRNPITRKVVKDKYGRKHTVCHQKGVVGAVRCPKRK